MGADPGLPGWVLNAVTSISMKGRRYLTKKESLLQKAAIRQWKQDAKLMALKVEKKGPKQRNARNAALEAGKGNRWSSPASRKKHSSDLILAPRDPLWTSDPQNPKGVNVSRFKPPSLH